MPKHREEYVRRVLPIGSENVRRRLDVEAGVGTSAQRAPLYNALVYTIVSLHHIQKHHGILRGIRRHMGGLSELDIDGYITQMQAERDQDELPRVHNEWLSKDDITPEEDSGDEYLPPGVTGGGDLESDLDFSGFNALEEEEEQQLFERDSDSDSDWESEGDGPAQPRGGGGWCSCAWWWCP